MVPVLSVTIVVVAPKAFTADSRLTNALRAATWRTPMASASVKVGSRPSGTLATIIPIAKSSPVQRCKSDHHRADNVKDYPRPNGEQRNDTGHVGDFPLQRARAMGTAARAARCGRTGNAPVAKTTASNPAARETLPANTMLAIFAGAVPSVETA